MPRERANCETRPVLRIDFDRGIDCASDWKLIVGFVYRPPSSGKDMGADQQLQLFVRMPKAPKQKFYAVKTGREGPRIYTSWEEVRRAIHGPNYVQIQILYIADKKERESHTMSSTPMARMRQLDICRRAVHVIGAIARNLQR